MIVKIPFIFCLVLIWNFSHAELDTKEFASSGLKELVVQSRSGDIKLSAHTASNDQSPAKVTFKKRDFAKTCELKIERQGDKLGVIVRQRGFVDVGNCQVDFVISLPSTIKLNIKLGAGNVDVRGFEKDLVYEIGSGDLAGESPFETVTGQIGSGNVRLRGLVGVGSFKSGSGDFELQFSKVPTKGALNVEVASGNIQISLPKQTKIQARLSTVVGNVANALGDSTDAGYRVTLKSATGDLKIGAQ